MKLFKYFSNSNNVLESKVGIFTLNKSLHKQGGNSDVLFFKRENSDCDFAIKFLTKNYESSEKKINRFIDEYFSLAQIPPHKNIVKQYHLDYFEYKDSDGKVKKIYYIIMKRYECSLNDIDKKDINGLDVLNQIGSALQHVHRFGIIHRDIKPANIFYDNDIKEYVLGDFGIAHFNDEKVARLSNTDKSDRLANFSFSPEELATGGPITPATDIFSLGQVIQWCFNGVSSKGTGRPYIGDKNDIVDFALNLVVEKCLQSDVNNRFQSVDELFDNFKTLSSPKKIDIYKKCHDLDRLFRSSFPTIRNIYESSDDVKINRFVDNLNKELDDDDFWCMDISGGDNVFKGLRKLDENSFILNNYCEINIDKIIAYRDESRLYNSFFIILVNPSSPFDLYDGFKNKVERNVEGWKIDAACIYENQYMNPELFDNQYIEIYDQVKKVEINDYTYRERNLVPFAYIVCPRQSGPNRVTNRHIVTDMLKSVLNCKRLDEKILDDYIEKIFPFHSLEYKLYD